MKKKVLVVSLVLVLVTSGAAMAKHRAEKGQISQKPMMAGQMLADLDLTPKQTEVARAMMEAMQKELIPLRTKAFQERMELKLLWLQLNPDPATIKAKQKELFDLKWRIEERITDYRLSFRKILTPEQLSKFLLLRMSKNSGFGRDHGDYRGHPDHAGERGFPGPRGDRF